jgi:hypothetical protein
MMGLLVALHPDVRLNRWRRRYYPNCQKSVSRADDARSSLARPLDQTGLVGRKAVDEDLV